MPHSQVSIWANLHRRELYAKGGPRIWGCCPEGGGIDSPRHQPARHKHTGYVCDTVHFNHIEGRAPRVWVICTGVWRYICLAWLLLRVSTTSLPMGFSYAHLMMMQLYTVQSPEIRLEYGGRREPCLYVRFGPT